MKLILPTAEYTEQIRAYRQEFLDSGSSMDGTGALREIADPAEWLRWTEACTAAETVPEPGFEKYGGHIGYSVAPSERRKGCASEMLRLTLPKCRELGLERVLITCDSDNEGSRRTILNNGGVYESTVYEENEGVFLERYWIDIP